MLFLRNSFSYSPHLTLRRYSQTWSSVQFLTASGPSVSENSELVGLAKPVPDEGIAGALREGGMLEEELAVKVVPVVASEAGKEDLEANMAILSCQELKLEERGRFRELQEGLGVVALS